MYAKFTLVLLLACVFFFVDAKKKKTTDAKTTADAALFKVVKELISTYPSLEDIEDLTEEVCALQENGTTLEDVYSTNETSLVTYITSLLTKKQLKEIDAAVEALTKDFGANTTAFVYDFFNQLEPVLKAFLSPMATAVEKDVADDEAFSDACADGINIATKELTKCSIESFVATLKAYYTAQQCEDIYKALNPSILLLSKYNFIKPACTGTGPAL